MASFTSPFAAVANPSARLRTPMMPHDASFDDSSLLNSGEAQTPKSIANDDLRVKFSSDMSRIHRPFGLGDDLAPLSYQNGLDMSFEVSSPSIDLNETVALLNESRMTAYDDEGDDGPITFNPNFVVKRGQQQPAAPTPASRQSKGKGKGNDSNINTPDLSLFPTPDARPSS